ncbi:MAG: SDR family NAD(P)-dependent oxidoreductase [Bacteroidetes bacterium]|nr:SDR family NAD(P)-dependent oxidoreductase [Bacteroidota bacterium]MBS1930655.1 SDR family NAD(P)-dependent oxidoreductase [Bacteroidota bacterium]
MNTIIVTGASGNLGQAVVKKFLTDKYKVIGTVIPNDPVTIEIRNPNFEKVIVDLLNEEATQKFIDSVILKYGSIDAIVLTVGGFAMGKIADTKASDILKQYKLNFETAYNTVRPVFTQMLKQNGGRIFMIGSRAGSGMHFSKGVVAYGLTKSLIFRLAELMNDEAKDQNVVTSVIVPSTIDTPQNRKSMPDADFSKWVKPEDIADVISFYCSAGGSILREPIIKVYGRS